MADYDKYLVLSCRLTTSTLQECLNYGHSIGYEYIEILPQAGGAALVIFRRSDLDAMVGEVVEDVVKEVLGSDGHGQG